MTFVTRAGLLALVQLEQTRLISVVAPAGWGKSVFARALAARAERSFAVDLTGMSGAPVLAHALLAGLGADEISDAAAVEAAISAWRAPSITSLVVVLDHLDVVRHHASLADCLTRLLDRPLAQRCVIACSRKGLPIRTTRFAAPHERLVFGVRQLRFDGDDIGAVLPPGLPAAAAARVADITRGWPIGVLYLARAAREGRFAEACRELLRGDAAAVNEYLQHEVLAPLAPLERDVLRACVAIDDLAVGDVANALSVELQDASDLLADVPFVERDPVTLAYRVDPILRAYLQRLEPLELDIVLRTTGEAQLAAGAERRGAQLLMRRSDAGPLTAALDEVRALRLQGDRAAERAALEAAQALAVRSGVPYFVHVAARELAVHEWFWGADEPMVAPAGSLIALLIAAAAARDRSAALRLANAAVDAADAAQAKLERVLSRVAAALLAPHAEREERFAGAARYAVLSESAELTWAVAAAGAGEPAFGMLDAFVRRFRRFAEPAGDAALNLKLFDLTVERGSTRLVLQHRELEVLAALALKRGTTREQLAERIWPDQTAAAAANNLKVYMSRLRRRLGPEAIVSTRIGFEIAADVRIDVDEAEAALRAAHGSDDLDDAARSALRDAARTDLDALGSLVSGWRWFDGFLARIEGVARDAALQLAADALRRADWLTAFDYADRLLVRDVSDTAAHQCAQEALDGLGDTVGIARLKRRVAAAVSTAEGDHA